MSDLVFLPYSVSVVLKDYDRAYAVATDRQIGRSLLQWIFMRAKLISEVVLPIVFECSLSLIELFGLEIPVRILWLIVTVLYKSILC